MKRALIVFMILGGLAARPGSAAANEEPVRGRTVQGDYEAPWLPWFRNCPLSGESGCVSIPTYSGEGLFTAKVTDAHGQPVLVSVWGDDTMYGTFCGETTEPMSFDPGAQLRFSVGWASPATTPLACLPGIATTGTVAVTLFGVPPSDTPSASPTPDASPTAQPPPPTQTETVERSVHLVMRRHLWSEGSVGSDDASCRSDVPVIIQRKRWGGWVEVASTTTNSDGAFAVELTDRAGRYRVVAPEVGSSERTCLEAASSTVRHRH